MQLSQKLKILELILAEPWSHSEFNNFSDDELDAVRQFTDKLASKIQLILDDVPTTIVVDRHTGQPLTDWMETVFQTIQQSYPEFSYESYYSNEYNIQYKIQYDNNIAYIDTYVNNWFNIQSDVDSEHDYFESMINSTGIPFNFKNENE